MSDSMAIDKIKAILKNIFPNTNVEPFTGDTPLKEVSFDSVLYIQFIVMIESEFNVEFEDEILRFDSFSKLDDIINYIESKQ